MFSEEKIKKTKLKRKTTMRWNWVRKRRWNKKWRRRRRRGNKKWRRK